MDKADFWMDIIDTWVYDKLNSTDARHITPKHSTFQKIVEYFKGAKYIVKEEGNNISIEIVHPKYITPPAYGTTGLIRKMDVVLREDGLEARIRLNVPLTEDWIIHASKCEEKDNYKFDKLNYNGYTISKGRAA